VVGSWGGRLRGCGARGGHGCVVLPYMGYWEKRMSAVSSLIDAVVAVPPLPFIAVVTFPVTRVRPFAAYIAEHSSF